MTWEPIQDLPEDWPTLASSELPALVSVWNEQAQKLRTSEAFKTYMEKLIREVAIETGVIENLYSLDRGVTYLLIEQGINEAFISHDSTLNAASRGNSCAQLFYGREKNDFSD